MGYIAPEIYMREPYSFKADLFSFGVLMFKILSGKRPWPAGPQELTGRKTVNLEYRIVNEHWEGVSNYGRDFIRKLLVFEHERMDANQASQHEWLYEETATILRSDMLDSSDQNTYSQALIDQNPQATESREHSRCWLEDDILGALQTFIPLGAFRGGIVPNPDGGPSWVEERPKENARLLPYYIIGTSSYTERECRNVCRELAKCIHLFHNGNVVHRKLHMENVVVEGQVSCRVLGAGLCSAVQSHLLIFSSPINLTFMSVCVVCSMLN